jgi:VanZ family protein
MTNKTRLIATLPAIILTLGIIYVSNQPNITLPDLKFEFLDKLLHFLAYFGYGISLQFAFKANFRQINGWKAIFILIMFGAFFGFTDEWHQSFIPGRYADFYDWLADTLGLSSSLLFYGMIKRILKII